MPATINRDEVYEALRTVYDPEIPVNVVDLGLIYDVQVSDANDVFVQMTLTFPRVRHGPAHRATGGVGHSGRGRRGGGQHRVDVRSSLVSRSDQRRSPQHAGHLVPNWRGEDHPDTESSPTMATPQQPNAQQNARLEQIRRQWEQKRQITDRLASVRTTIGVYSGKGGVGKTTVACNLATILAKQGERVGLLDVDIDCPNVTRVMGITDKPDYRDGEISPAEGHGVKVVSMAFFQENEDEAIIWRGPMIHNAINQFLQATDWGELDYLIVDLPPGTSDSPLTVMQTLPMDGFVVVSTPQDLAIIDAKRCINMIRKLNLNVVGIVENYAGDIFGQGAGRELAEDIDAPFLGSMSLSPSYRDTSKPTVLVDDTVSGEYASVADELRRSLKAHGREA